MNLLKMNRYVPNQGKPDFWSTDCEVYGSIPGVGASTWTALIEVGLPGDLQVFYYYGRAIGFRKDGIVVAMMNFDGSTGLGIWLNRIQPDKKARLSRDDFARALKAAMMDACARGFEFLSPPPPAPPEPLTREEAGECEASADGRDCTTRGDGFVCRNCRKTLRQEPGKPEVDQADLPCTNIIFEDENGGSTWIADGQAPPPNVSGSYTTCIDRGESTKCNHCIARMNKIAMEALG